jgi:hypothetical protein
MSRVVATGEKNTLISGQPVKVSGETVTVASGAVVQVYSGTLYLASGTGVVTGPSGGGQVSGAVVVSGFVSLYSGQVSVESGEIHVLSGQLIAKVSGETVTVASGAPVLLLSGSSYTSGNICTIYSGTLYLASGTGVVTSPSGGGQVSGAVVVSGFVSLYSGQVSIESGEVHVLSGQLIAKVSGETVTVASGAAVLLLSGSSYVSGNICTIYSGTLYLASGTGVVTSPSGGGQVSGAVIVSGFVSVYSGQIAISSGEIHILSGQLIAKVSGEIVDLAIPTSIKILNSGNPLLLNDNSGGVNLLSGSVYSVTVKALASNSGDVYVGGSAAANYPFSGQGFLLSPGEAISLDTDDMGRVKCVCTVSGWCKVTYLGVK